jgi:ATP-dependent RNA helicase
MVRNNKDKIYSSSSNIEIISSFDDMSLSDDLKRGIYQAGFTEPSAIQARAIKPILEGRDVVAQSQSGTGKTTIFCIGVLAQINPKKQELQALVLSPTRELSEQTQSVLISLGDFMKARVHCCIGGRSINGDLQSLGAGVHVVSGIQILYRQIT